MSNKTKKIIGAVVEERLVFRKSMRLVVKYMGNKNYYAALYSPHNELMFEDWFTNKPRVYHWVKEKENYIKDTLEPLRDLLTQPHLFALRLYELCEELSDTLFNSKNGWYILTVTYFDLNRLSIRVNKIKISKPKS